MERKGLLSFLLVLALGGAILLAVSGYVRTDYFDYSELITSEKTFYTSQDLEHAYINAMRKGFDRGNGEYQVQVGTKTLCVIDRAAEEVGMDVLLEVISGGAASVALDEVSPCTSCLITTLDNLDPETCRWINSIKRCSTKCGCGTFPDYSQIVNNDINLYTSRLTGSTIMYNGYTTSWSGRECYYTEFDYTTCEGRLWISKRRPPSPPCQISLTLHGRLTKTYKIPELRYSKTLPLSGSYLLDLIEGEGG